MAKKRAAKKSASKKKKAVKKSAPKKRATKKAAAKKRVVKKAAAKKTAKKSAAKKRGARKAAAKKRVAKKTAAKKTAAKKAPAKKAPAKKAPAKKAPAKKAPGKKAPAKKVAPPAPAKAAPAADAAEPAIQPAPEVGTKAPTFTLPSDGGGEVSLESLRGKNVVLYFYPRDDTPGCTVEACGFRDASSELAGANAVVLGVSRDTVKKHDKFKAKFNLDFPLLSDPAGEVISAYGSWGPKKFMGREFNGILRTTFIIDKDGNVAKAFPKVSPKTHAAEILAALSELS
ncbi:MAG: thioredoxin-dependent thiol peroxidase [Deltaproteobacteria bacterium]